MKARLLHAGRGRIEHDRAGHEGKFEGAFPIGAGSHGILQLIGDSGEFGGRGTELQPRLAVLVPGSSVARDVSAQEMPWPTKNSRFIETSVTSRRPPSRAASLQSRHPSAGDLSSR